MDPITMFNTAFATVKTATDIAKSVKNAGDSLLKAETNFKLAELIEALADAKINLVEIRELLEEKEEAFKALEAQIKVRKSMVYEAPYYWIEIADDKKDGPYCQACYDSAELLIRLQNPREGEWKCNKCDSYFRTDSYSLPMPVVVTPHRRSRNYDGI